MSRPLPNAVALTIGYTFLDRSHAQAKRCRLIFSRAGKLQETKGKNRKMSNRAVRGCMIGEP
jgi:hypothetical protein